MREEIEEGVRDTLSSMRLCAIYNKVTGASISHWEFAELGINEEARVLAALQLWEL